ncbi:hypothetical protein ACVSQB_38855 [Bradyrhizobium elkanii]
MGTIKTIDIARRREATSGNVRSGEPRLGGGANEKHHAPALELQEFETKVISNADT